MSFNQSKGEKSESQYRKPARSVNPGNNPRTSSGAAGGKGGGGNAPPPQPSLATNRSFNNKKPGTGGGQSRVGVPNSNSQFNTSATRPSQNGGHFQSPASGFSEAPAPVGAVKPTNPPAPRSTRPVPKAPSSQTVPGGFDSVAPSTPSKADAPKSFQLQFGSISPGVVNGMQIPARTSSAPPNLDEQKRDQAQHESFRAPPTIPPPSASKQQLPLKDSGTNKPLATEELHAASSHAKRDVHPQVPSAAGTTVTQKPSVHHIPGISMPMPFQSQVPIPFGGPNSQIQSQGVPTTSLQMPMPLSVGSGAHVQQQVFVQGLQSHSIQPQGMMPQGQNLSFTTQIGHQMPPQMANMGIGISPQYSQQPGKLVSHRKAVKITHPDTHEELRLDRRTDSYKDSGSSGVRSHPNVPTQTQPMPPFTPHQISYYPPMQPGSYNHSMYFPTTQTAVPLTSAQMSAGPQGPRYTYPGQAPTTISFKNPSTLNPLPGGKNSEHPHDSQVATGSVSLPSVQVTVRPVVVSMGEGVGTSSVTVSSPVVSKGESPKLLTAKGKKKKKDILKAADAAGSTSERSCRKMTAKGKKKRKDILKQENVVPGESIESSCSILSIQIKGEPDDWEYAAELSTPKLNTFVGKQGRAGSAGNNEDGNISKKYSRDFLLTLSEQCTDLPTGFEIRKDIAESLMSVQVGISHLIANELNEAEQRQLKAILNKLSPRNFEKALMEPRFCAMFANICSHFAAELPDFSEDNEKITFKRLLLNKCQEEFEREQPEANRVEEEREEKRIQARRRMLGNIRLIGELYKKNMLTERIMHEWIKRLLGKNQTPDEEDIESLCKLMSTIGVMIDHPQAKEHMDTYFDIMTKFSNNMELSSRVRFMLKDSIDLRNNKWQHRRKVKGWKKIDQVHCNTCHGNRDLRDMSISAIREFYSAKDKDELALCIKELNAPSFYPSMVSAWVTDSFERKDLERDLLARLLVNLTKPRDSLLNQVHLIKGFESVLGTLEEAVIDAPKAAEFLGRILARVIMENVVPLKDIGHLIHEGGDEPGRLQQIGLAAEVLGSVLEIIKFEKGESVFNEIRTSSGLRLEDFRPPDRHKMRMLEAFF